MLYCWWKFCLYLRFPQVYWNLCLKFLLVSHYYQKLFCYCSKFFVKNLQEERTDSFPKYSIVRANCIIWFSKKTSFSFAKLTQKFHWWLRHFLDSLFLVFKNLFPNFGLFIIAFLSSFVITLQLFERIYFIFCSVLVKNIYYTKNKVFY